MTKGTTAAPDPHRVIIVGGGFGGLYAAQSLRRARVDLTLLDRRNFHLFQPLLYQVATGAYRRATSRLRCAGCYAATATPECCWPMW